jgi:hypothetical protein
LKVLIWTPKKLFPYLDIYRLIDLSACSQIEICFWPFW